MEDIYFCWILASDVAGKITIAKVNGDSVPMTETKLLDSSSGYYIKSFLPVRGILI